MPILTRRAFAAAMTASLAAPAIRRAQAADPVRLRLSVESLPSHTRTISATDFCHKLEAASGGEIKTELFHSGQLFNDQNVVTALLQNQVEMSIPGNWGLAGFIPSVDVLQLPILYSRSLDLAHRVIDGTTGQMVDAELETKLKMKVLGRWLDLGFESWYSTNKKLASVDDLKGMKIRNSGGAGKAWRTTFFGAIPNTTPWPSVPLALSQGTFDGLITAHETVASASLWESGVHNALEDRQTFNAYVPLVAGAFWRGLSPKLQGVLTETWDANIAAYRDNMAKSQLAARDRLTQHGVTITTPDAQAIAAVRTRMLAQQDQLIKQWRITPAIAAQAAVELEHGA